MYAGEIQHKPVRGRRSARPRHRYITYALITSLLSLLIALALAEWVIRLHDSFITNSEYMDPGLLIYDSSLGWRMKPGWSGSHRHYDFDVVYQIDAAGFRVDPSRQDSRRRIAVLGDSFTFGLGVSTAETFVHLLNTDVQSKMSFVNMGVPGYSTDQEYLLYRRLGESIDADTVLLVVYLGNDLFDNELPYPLQSDHAKPYFSLDQDDRLIPENIPVPRASKPVTDKQGDPAALVSTTVEQAASNWSVRYLGQLRLSRRLGIFQRGTGKPPASAVNDRLHKPLRLFAALVDALGQTSNGLGANLDLVLLPGVSYVNRPQSLSALYQEQLRKTILERIDESRSIRVFDIAKDMRRESVSDRSKQAWFLPNDGHLSAQGHRYVARRLAGMLNDSQQ